MAEGLDPLSPDTDGDGLLDGEEIALGTDPQNDDSDGDGILDGTEVGLGLDPSTPDPTTTIVGRVTDEEGASVEGASVVTLGTLTTLSDVNGEFILPDVPVLSDVLVTATLVSGGWSSTASRRRRPVCSAARPMWETLWSSRSSEG